MARTVSRFIKGEVGVRIRVWAVPTGCKEIQVEPQAATYLIGPYNVDPHQL